MALGVTLSCGDASRARHGSRTFVKHPTTRPYRSLLLAVLSNTTCGWVLSFRLHEHDIVNMTLCGAHNREYTTVLIFCLRCGPAGVSGHLWSHSLDGGGPQQPTCTSSFRSDIPSLCGLRTACRSRLCVCVCVCDV